MAIIADKAVLVTGGNRGIGRALVEDALRRGAKRVYVVNNVSAEALAPLPLTPAYALSKAAAFNLTQSLRALLAPHDVKVHAVLTGPTDTDMTRGLDLPKASPESVARAILDGVEKEEEDIFPDPLSASMDVSWRGSAVMAMERQLASFVQAA
jgi:NAD(P)-dependent dehydrogenase (short-subunit alcohol dehydrogenase family)